MKKQKLWALPLNEKTMKHAQAHEFFYAARGHCLIIASEQPEHSMEASEEIIKLLSLEEWQWIYASGQEIARRQAEENAVDIEALAKKVAENFLAELAKVERSGIDEPNEPGNGKTE